MIWFISDPHFGHKNIIEYSNRPFKSVEEQTNVIIENINKNVKSEDTLIFLGDVFMYFKKAQNQRVFDSINCKHKWLITGNHDERSVKVNGWAGIKTDWFFRVKDETVKGNFIYIHLYHYPILNWNGKWKGRMPDCSGTWHLYGHSHNGQEHPDWEKLPVMNICVENTNYQPVSYLQLKQKFDKWIKK